MMHCFSFLSVLSLRLCVCFSTACQTFVFLLIVCVLSRLMLVISLRSFSYSIGVFTEHRSSQACYPAGRGLRSWAPLMLKCSTCSENSFLATQTQSFSCWYVQQIWFPARRRGEDGTQTIEVAMTTVQRCTRRWTRVWEEPHFRLLQEHSGSFSITALMLHLHGSKQLLKCKVVTQQQL